jgi:hypothetical protein
MRKFRFSLAVLLVAIIFIGCDGLIKQPANSFSPPSWIQGTWSDETELNIFTFSSNNIRFSTKPYAYLVRTLREELERTKRESSEAEINKARDELARYESLEHVTTSVDFKEAYKSKQVSVTEQASNTSYAVSVTGSSSEGYINAQYSFHKTSGSTLGYTLYLNGTSIGAIELVR